MNVWNKIDTSRVVQGLAQQLESDHVPHAWLLLGPPGSGKRPVALAMAASLNCTTKTGAGCGTCRACARILRKRHPDVHHVIPEGPLIPVDVIREQVIPEAARSPFEGRRKVFVIEEADRMNDAAQNALLKTLEEPQPDTVFILLSEHEEEVLETIRSRCRIVRLDPVAEARLVELLEEDGAPTDAALLAARLADGDLERARLLAEEPAAMARRDLYLSIPRRLGGPSDALDAAAEILDHARGAVKDREKGQKKEVQDLAEAMGEGRGTAAARNALAKRHKRELRRLEAEILEEALATLASFYRDVLAARRGATESIVNIDRLAELQHWTTHPAPDAAFVHVVHRLVEAQGGSEMNANPALMLESVLLEAARAIPVGAPSAR